MRIAWHVAAVAKNGIEINEIRKDHAAVRKFPQGFKGSIEMFHVAVAFDLLAGKAVRKNIAYFADRHDRAPGFREPFKEITRRRWEPEILAMRGAEESFAFIAREGTRDHPPYIERIAQAPRDAAKIVKPVAAKDW